MADCPDFGCAICDQCTAADKAAAADKATPTPGDSESPKAPLTPAEEAQKLRNQIADSTIVFVLGHLEDTPGIKQVDEYSGLNGYHIRTIPGRRWSTPIMIGAGAGYLAVVDRFQDYDVIRVTDKYAGAGTAGFDSDGFPLDSVDWASLPDICSEPTPKGTRVVGLKIIPQCGGMLIASLSGTSEYLTFDIFGHVHGEVSNQLEGHRTLNPPYDLAGYLTGTPAFVSANPEDLMFTVASIIISEGGTEAIVALIDTIKHKVIGIQGIPATPKPLSATVSNGVISVLSGDNGIGTQIIRFTINLNGKGILAGRNSGKSTPVPQDFTINQFPTMKDLQGQEITPELLNKYYRAAAIINEKPNAPNRMPTIPGSFSDLPAVGESSTVMNDNRVSTEAHVNVEYYGNINVPVQMIAVDPKLGLVALESDFGTVTELFNRRTLNPTTGKYTGPMDRTKPIFRVLHGMHYDIIAEGGYTFGADNTYGPEDTRGASNTSGLVGESLAVDKGYETGTLKLIDAKAALIDATTGLFIYRHPKPQNGYRVYGGDYAALDPVQDNSALEVEIMALEDDTNRLQVLYGGDDPPNAELQAAQNWLATLRNRLTALKMTGIGVVRTQATLAAENAVMAVDGVERSVVSPWEAPWLIPGRTVVNGSPIAAFNTSGCADNFWNMFVRSPGVSNEFDTILMRRNWSSAYTDPITGDPVFFPEWAASNVSPIQVASQRVSALVPWFDPTQPTRWPMLLNAVGRGGFFVRGLPYVTMSNVDRYAEEAAALASLNDGYTRVINDPASPLALVAQCVGYIAEDNARIAYISTVPFWGELPITPRSILGMKFHKLNKSVGQVVDATKTPPYVDEDMTIDPTIIPNLAPGDTIPIGAVTAKRGCVINGGPWAFVAVTIKFQADDITHGVNVYANPEARRNGLGNRVGGWAADAESLAVWGTIGGSYYEAGYKASPFGYDPPGAWGTWGYSIQGDAPLIDIHDLPDRELFVNMLAPADAKALLLADQNGDIGGSTDEIFQKTHYFLTQTPLHAIVVKFWLRHHAGDVFRWGWMTESHNYPRTAGQLCYTIDPGFNTGIESILEAPGCGGTLSGMGGGKLFATDPTYPQLGHDVVLGTAIFTCAPNPYEALGLAYGTIWKCDVDFNFNNNLRALDVPLLPSDAEKPGT